MAKRLLAIDDVGEMTGYSRSSVYRLMKDSDFPIPLKMGRGSIRWHESEIDAWIDSRPRADVQVG